MLPKEMRHISGCGCGCGGVSSRVHGAVKYSTGWLQIRFSLFILMPTFMLIRPTFTFLSTKKDIK